MTAENFNLESFNLEVGQILDGKNNQPLRSAVNMAIEELRLSKIIFNIRTVSDATEQIETAYLIEKRLRQKFHELNIFDDGDKVESLKQCYYIMEDTTENGIEERLYRTPPDWGITGTSCGIRIMNTPRDSQLRNTPQAGRYNTINLNPYGLCLSLFNVGLLQPNGDTYLMPSNRTVLLPIEYDDIELFTAIPREALLARQALKH